MRDFPKESFDKLVREFGLIEDLHDLGIRIENDFEVKVGGVYYSDSAYLGVTLHVDVEDRLNLTGSIFENIPGIVESSRTLRLCVEDNAINLYEKLTELIDDADYRNMLIPFLVDDKPVALVFHHILFQGFSDVKISPDDIVSDTWVQVKTFGDSKVYMKRISGIDSVEEFNFLLYVEN